LLLPLIFSIENMDRRHHRRFRDGRDQCLRQRLMLRVIDEGTSDE